MGEYLSASLHRVHRDRKLILSFSLLQILMMFVPGAFVSSAKTLKLTAPYSSFSFHSRCYLLLAVAFWYASSLSDLVLVLSLDSDAEACVFLSSSLFFFPGTTLGRTRSSHARLGFFRFRIIPSPCWSSLCVSHLIFSHFPPFRLRSFVSRVHFCRGSLFSLLFFLVRRYTRPGQKYQEAEAESVRRFEGGSRRVQRLWIE